MGGATYYWCVKSSLSKDGEIYFHADYIEVNSNGDMIGWREKEDAKFQTLVIASGQWTVFYAAKCFCGSPVFVEHWKGEVHSSND
jgi:hypothetical protein